MRNLRHRPSVHEFSHGAEKIIELLEDMRPFVHIFFVDIFPPIFALAFVVGAYKVVTAPETPVPFVRAIKVVNSVGGISVVMPVHFRHHGMH